MKPSAKNCERLCPQWPEGVNLAELSRTAEELTEIADQATEAGKSARTVERLREIAIETCVLVDEMGCEPGPWKSDGAPREINCGIYKGVAYVGSKGTTEFERGK